MKTLRIILCFVFLLSTFTLNANAFKKVNMGKIYFHLPVEWKVKKNSNKQIVKCFAGEELKRAEALLILKSINKPAIKDKRLVGKMHSFLSNDLKGLSKKDWKNIKILPRATIISCVYMTTIQFAKQDGSTVSDYFLFSFTENNQTFIGGVVEHHEVGERPHLADIDQILGSFCIAAE